MGVGQINHVLRSSFLVLITTKYQVAKVHLLLIFKDIFSFHSGLNRVGLYRKSENTNQVY
jgi:hypothetical protein